MKSATSSLIITLSFLLWFSFTTTKPLSLAFAVEQVHDVDGDPLVPGQWYYIASSTGEGSGGEVSLLMNSRCAPEVGLLRPDSDRGIPVRFQVPFISTGCVNPEIEFFSWTPSCLASFKWSVAYEAGSSLSSARLIVGGPENHQGSTLVSGSFRIEKLPESYKLAFCPNSSGTCYDVGIREDGYYGRLVLSTGNIFMFSFLKATGFVSGLEKSNIYESSI